jgi:hypothetical protein
MSASDPRIQAFLGALKQEGRSSPEDWHAFHLFLQLKKHLGQKDPPVPLILAASGESDASKHHRLSSQLEWALANGCLDDALRYLEKIPVERWNSCPLEHWNQDSYPSWPTYEEKWNLKPKPKISAEPAVNAIEILRADTGMRLQVRELVASPRPFGLQVRKDGD